MSHDTNQDDLSLRSIENDDSAFYALHGLVRLFPFNMLCHCNIEYSM